MPPILCWGRQTESLVRDAGTFIKAVQLHVDISGLMR